MANLNSVASHNEYSNNSTVANSLDDIKNFLAKKNIKKMIIEKMAQSFMAKIPAGTRVELMNNMLKVGESTIKLGENIYLTAEKTQALMERTQTRAMSIINHNYPAVQKSKLPAVSDKKLPVAANDENYQMAA